MLQCDAPLLCPATASPTPCPCAEFSFRTAPLVGAASLPYRLGLIGDLGQSDHSLRCDSCSENHQRRLVASWIGLMNAQIAVKLMLKVSPAWGRAYTACAGKQTRDADLVSACWTRLPLCSLPLNAAAASSTFPFPGNAAAAFFSAALCAAACAAACAFSCGECASFCCCMRLFLC